MARIKKIKIPKTQKGRAKSTPRKRRSLAWLLIKWGLIAAIWGTVGLAGLIGWYAWDLPRLTDVPALARRPAVTLLAADGTPFARFGEATSRPVRVANLPPHVPRAVVAIEDHRFYRHFGIDLIGLLRAAAINLWAGRIRQGGSTITQQLAKNLFLGPERTARRKVQEMVLALWLEKRFTKDQILSLYLNRVYFGAGNFGIEAAAESYFGKPAKRLQLNEAAMLAGLLKAPSRYAPHRHRDRAAKRARLVLNAMAENGFITAAQANIIKRNPARLGRQRARVGRYFADWALEQARGYVGSATGDLVVRTTLDLRLQRIAEREAERIGPAAAKSRVGQFAVVMMKPGGAVTAMVGGADYAKSQFNRATQALRQPGSAFKPFVYLAGLESGLTPKSVLTDEPVTLGNFSPRNYGDRYLGRVTMTQAMAGSLNSVAVRILWRAGTDRVVSWARRLGITSPLRREAGLALGVSEVTLTELAAAYAAFANGGEGVFAHGVTEIRDSAGQILYRRQGSGPGTKIASGMLYDINLMMNAVLEQGTGRNARFGWPAGVKSGTTQEHRDAWFLGYTTRYVTGVWMGNDDGAPMKNVTGGGLPARLWKRIMVPAHEGLERERLPGGRDSGWFWSGWFGDAPDDPNRARPGGGE